jgi:RNA polymerase sigma-54 factor
MRLDTGQHLRIDQRLKLAPRMIQAMEILQMPTVALEERINQELASNPTLELREEEPDKRALRELKNDNLRDAHEGERTMVAGDAQKDPGQAADFERLTNFSQDQPEAAGNQYDDDRPFRRRVSDDDRDAKQEALLNHASRPESLLDQLDHQWALLELEHPEDRPVGLYLASLVDPAGYLRLSDEEMLKDAPPRTTLQQLHRTVKTMQDNLEPPGICARNLRECLLLQLDARLAELRDELGLQPDATLAEIDEDLARARIIVDKHLPEVETNRLPKIAKALGVDVDDVNKAILALRHFSPHPGRGLVQEANRAIVPDVLVNYDPDEDRYTVRLNDSRLPGLTLNPTYQQMSRDKTADKKTREFVTNNLRSASWLMDAIKQRQQTLLKVATIVVNAQREFLDRGPQALKPLPMAQVAEEVGVHVATISRAVHEKYLQTPLGIFPLRDFFSGGTETDAGESMSWSAVQAKLKELIEAEDKSNPLSDDELVDKLKAAGIEIARRTVAKYRKEMNIPTGRMRRIY